MMFETNLNLNIDYFEFGYCSIQIWVCNSSSLNIVFQIFLNMVYYKFEYCLQVIWILFETNLILFVTDYIWYYAFLQVWILFASEFHIFQNINLITGCNWFEYCLRVIWILFTIDLKIVDYNFEYCLTKLHITFCE